MQVDESLSDLERCALFLQSDQPLQAAHAMHALPDLVRRHGRAVFVTAGPHLRRHLGSRDADVSVAFAAALQSIVEQALLHVRRRRTIAASQ